MDERRSDVALLQMPSQEARRTGTETSRAAISTSRNPVFKLLAAPVRRIQPRKKIATVILTVETGSPLPRRRAR
jgi:hypothetical protein